MCFYFYIIIKAQTVSSTTWFTMHEECSPETTTLKVLQLVLCILYYLRITAWNVVDPTKDFQTIQETPMHTSYNVTVHEFLCNFFY